MTACSSPDWACIGSIPTTGPLITAILKRKLSVYLEYGLTDRITLVGRGAYQQLHHRIRPTKKKPAHAAIGNWRAGARRAHRLDAACGAGRARFKSWPAFLARERTGSMKPSAPGAGMLISARSLAGRSRRLQPLFEAAAGVRLRGEGASNEVRLDLTAGCDFVLGTALMMQTYSVWALGAKPGRTFLYRPSLAGVASGSDHGAPTWRRSLCSPPLTSSSMSEETAFIASLWRSF
jgi:hypothetical protein